VTSPLALVSVGLVNSWAVVPFSALVYRAAMLDIPSDEIEAAEVDGAARHQEVRYIVLPHLRPTTVVLVVLIVVYAFRSFDYIYVMTDGGPGTSTTTLPFLSYMEAFVSFQYGVGSAAAVLAICVVFALALVYTLGVRREEQRL